MARSAPSLGVREAFARDVEALTFRRLRIAGVVYASAHVLFTIVVLAVAELHLPLSQILLRRAIAILVSLGFSAATYAKSLEKHAFLLSAALTLATSLYLLEPVLSFGIPAFDRTSMLLLVVSSGLLFPYTMRQMLALTALIGALVLVVVAVRFTPVYVVEIVELAFWQIGASAMVVVGALVSSRLRESEFHARFELSREREAAEQLLLNILPEKIVERLKRDQTSIAEGFLEATVLFADIVDFTPLSAKMSPSKLVEMLNEVFSRFDALTEKHGLEKIKTIGDSYMAVAGVPVPRKDHAAAVARMALEMREVMSGSSTPTGEPLRIRIGINSGPVVAGVIGTKKFAYDLWGDTVNTASRMEAHAEPGTIQVTERVYERLRTQFLFEPRGTIEVKGKGPMKTYVLVGARRSLRPPPVA
jgi:class 3 adenylate cyclase